MTDTTASPPSTIDYAEVVASPELIELKRRQRLFAFPMAVFFLAWYFAFVLLAAFAPQFMATPVFGVVNLGLILGLGQFVTTFTITMVYVSYANRRLDPLSAELRATLEAASADTKDAA
jgi:uncharacterized membrane protein (DUF485 family)